MPNATLQNYDRLAGGELIPKLRTWRAAGLSCLTCSRLLEVDFNLRVSAAQVRRWAHDIDIEAPAEA